MNKINLSAGLILLLTSAAFASDSATIPKQYYGSKPEVQYTKKYPSKMHPAISRANQVPAQKKIVSNPETVTEDVMVPVKTHEVSPPKAPVVPTPTAKATIAPSKLSSVKVSAVTPSVKQEKSVVTPTPLKQSPTVAAVTTPNKVPLPPKTQVAIPQVEPIIIAVPKASSVETQVPQAKANKVIVPIAIPMETQIPQAKPSKVILPIAIPVETQVPQAQPNKVIVPTVTPVEAEVPIARPIKIIYPEANE